MTEFNSRWEFTKKRSQWHFDNTLPAFSGDDSYTSVCRFLGDFTDAINEGYSRSVPVSWVGMSNPGDSIGVGRSPGLIGLNEKTIRATEADFIKMGADASIETYDTAVVNDIDIFTKMAEILGFVDYDIKFHNQRTGQMITQHIDNFYEPDFLNESLEFSSPPVRRYIIFLEDWKLGQFISMGNAIIPPWRAGDAITWSVRDMPHGTANTGWENRPLIVITGKVTDDSEQFVMASKNNIIDILTISQSINNSNGC